ncbi:hypothetical protein GGI04_000530 [Coemansia thaxteri]|nr:hypothetical protein GGI04_000530 [Coemansia thaxteri]
MFKKGAFWSSGDWKLSACHPNIALDDVQPLLESHGDISSLPPAYQAPVELSFVKRLHDAACEPPNSNYIWLNAKQGPSTRLDSFVEFSNHCKPNEMVWLFSRYREVIFQILHQTFSCEIEFLNSLHERILSPTHAAMAQLWASLLCLHRLIELVPRVMASGWRQTEIENIILVVLDHGNNPDVRTLGFYTLCLYMAALCGGYSELTIDLFTNAVSLRAFSYVDMPAATKVVGKIMCAIASGVDIADIGCGQRSIRGKFEQCYSAAHMPWCDPFRDSCTRPVPVLALRVLINFMMESLVPKHAHMLSGGKLCMPNLDKDPLESGSQQEKSMSESQGEDSPTEATALRTRAFDTLRSTLLDRDPKSAGFFIGILRLSLLAPQNLDTGTAGKDAYDKSVLGQASYEACLGALTTIRLWLLSKEGHRPAHLLAGDDGRADALAGTLADYLDCVYGLVDWLVSNTSWNEKKVFLRFSRHRRP